MWPDGGQSGQMRHFFVSFFDDKIFVLKNKGKNMSSKNATKLELEKLCKSCMVF